MLWFQQSLCVVPAHQALHVYMGWCVCDVPVPFHAVVDLGGFSGCILCENNAAALGVEGFCQFCSVCSCNDSISGVSEEEQVNLFQGPLFKRLPWFLFCHVALVSISGSGCLTTQKRSKITYELCCLMIK